MLLSEIKTAGWEEDGILALHAFFYNVDGLDLRWLEDGPEIMVQYQAVVRKKWHDEIDKKTPDLLDISRISDDVLNDCKEIVASRRRKREKQAEIERDRRDKVSWDAQVEADDPPEPVPPAPRLPRAANPAPRPPPSLTFTAGKRVGRIGDQICAYARIEATKALSTALGDGYGLVPSENGLQIRPCNDFKAYQHVVPDESLSWAEVSDASYLFMAEIKALDWPREAVLAIHSFFYQPETHELRRPEGGLEVLIHYQAIVRKSWHDHIYRKVELFDISKIDDEMMADC
ncbi:hypothetical protein BXZ70DRAFT_1030876 [Cristinia sonorae]|uniref:Uncharacterized protein n=1 Tax=Cristinia sonorae TaxID=1940300 RepID=A0A8K0UKP4_9AGAR|nr:hypothetical protein BXZ70DRAFT_1030876 [Cristinia sonorae]